MITKIMNEFRIRMNLRPRKFIPSFTKIIRALLQLIISWVSSLTFSLFTLLAFSSSCSRSSCFWIFTSIFFFTSLSAFQDSKSCSSGFLAYTYTTIPTWCWTVLGGSKGLNSRTGASHFRKHAYFHIGRQRRYFIDFHVFIGLPRFLWLCHVLFSPKRVIFLRKF